MENRKLYLVLICIMFVVAAYLAVEIGQDNGIVLGREVSPKDRPLEWQNMIAADVNSGQIKMDVDGKEVEFTDGVIYMEENLSIMIPVNVVSKTFKCAVNKFNGESMTLQKGNTIVNLNKASSHIDKNGEIIDVITPMTVKDDVAYINASVMEKCFDYTYNWDSKINKLILDDTSLNENILPVKYSYTSIDRINEIRNQGSLNTCWAFSAIAALETSLLPYEDYSFSVDNMVGNSGFALTAKDGGDYLKAMAYLTSWRGPVSEDEDVYADGKVNADATVLKHVQEAHIIENKNLEAIKEAVFLYGGVQTSMYTSMNKAGQHSMYYNEETNSYCYIGTNKPNHGVTIIGWDDNYPKENFTVELEGNGAFICANSWGNAFGDNGIFYVSYYDSKVGTNNVVYTRVDDIGIYDKIYQSDLCGWVGQLGYEDESAYFANVYKAVANEKLEAVGFYATDKNTSYEISFVENFEDENSLNNRRILKSGTFDNAGFYTVDFEENLMLEAGKKYAVVVKITTPGAVHPVAIEYRAGKITKNVVLDDGEGYISLYGTSWEHIEETKKCNVCLKMYTKNLE